MRLGLPLLLALLVLPTTWATPLVDEGPAAFTYELIEGPNYRMKVTSPEIAYHDGKVGVAWLQNDYTPGWASFTIQVVVRDGAMTYRHEIISPSWPYVAFDGQGRFHVMYQVGTPGNRDVMVSTFDGQTWSAQVIDHAFVARGTDAVTRDGQPYFLAEINDIDGRLLAAKSRIYTLDPLTDGWVIAATHPTFVGSDSDLDVDSNGRLHLLWAPTSLSRPPEGYHDFYSIYENGTWTDNPAPYGTSIWSKGALSLGPEDKPYFAYNDANRNLHLYSPDANGVYQDETVDLRRGDRPILHVDDAGRVHILTWYWTGQFDVPTGVSWYYHRRDPVLGWSTQPMIPVAYQVGGSMVLDDEGQPIIAIPTSEFQTILRQQIVRDVSGLVVARPAHRAADGLVPRL